MGQRTLPHPEEMNPLPMELMARQVGDVHLTEILPNATNDGATFPDGEWIEIHNTGTTSIDPMGWSIMDGLGNITHFDPGTLVFNSTQGATIIDPDGRRLLQFTSYTQLWDDYNHVFLRDMTGTVVDTADYTTDYGEDMALIRGSNPSDSWTPAAWKTPVSPNRGACLPPPRFGFPNCCPTLRARTVKCGPWVNGLNSTTTERWTLTWQDGSSRRRLGR